ncbi:hypothetical protein BH20ACI2_BH20ACI2_02470 [soil metagenome]
MRALVPADSLVYLETNDLAAALRPIIDNEAFTKAAKTKPDISALRGVQLAVTVSGFEMTEEKLTEEHSVGRVQPRFVAIADTHAWNWQAIAFAESQIGAFVMDVYRSDVSQEKIEKHGGTWFTWTANDEQKAFALVIDSLVYFGNDEPALEKCLAVKRGETDSIVNTGKVDPFEASTIASGYVSPDGVAQGASLASLSMATRTDGEPEVQSAIADILPRLLRGAVSEFKWTASSSADGKIEDRIEITSPDEIARVFSDTLTTSGKPDRSLFDFVPNDIPSVTMYDLSKPNVAWRSVLLASQTLVTSVPGGMISEFANAFAEPYAIRDPELFLSGVGSSFVTGNIDPNGDKPVVIANVLIPTSVKNSIDQELKFDKALSDEFAVEVLRTPDGDLAVAFFESKVIAGNAEAVIACLRSRGTERTMGRSPAVVDLLTNGATAATLAVDREAAPAIANVLFRAEPSKVAFASAYTVETRFSRTGIQRRTVSDFGLIGSIITQLAGD